jgi:hypothetical protein
MKTFLRYVAGIVLLTLIPQWIGDLLGFRSQQEATPAMVVAVILYWVTVLGLAYAWLVRKKKKDQTGG